MLNRSGRRCRGLIQAVLLPLFTLYLHRIELLYLARIISSHSSVIVTATVKLNEEVRTMKRLLIGCIVLIVAIAGVLHGGTRGYQRDNGITLSEAYKGLYPETLAFDSMPPYPF